jgi:hypothetical protein
MGCLWDPLQDWLMSGSTSVCVGRDQSSGSPIQVKGGYWREINIYSFKPTTQPVYINTRVKRAIFPSLCKWNIQSEAIRKGKKLTVEKQDLPLDPPCRESHGLWEWLHLAGCCAWRLLLCTPNATSWDWNWPTPIRTLAVEHSRPTQPGTGQLLGIAALPDSILCHWSRALTTRVHGTQAAPRVKFWTVSGPEEIHFFLRHHCTM